MEPGLQWPLGPGKSHEQISSWGLQEDGRRTLRLCPAGPRAVLLWARPSGLRKPGQALAGCLVPLQCFWGPCSRKLLALLCVLPLVSCLCAAFRVVSPDFSSSSPVPSLLGLTGWKLLPPAPSVGLPWWLR